MRVVAIDPGRRSGWALGQGGRILVAGHTIQTKTYRRLWDIAIETLSILDAEANIDLVAIEDVFLKFPKSAVSVARSAQAWACAAYELDIDVVNVSPSTWQARHKLKKGETRNREALGEKTMQIARLLYPPVKQQDEASAVLIAAWAMEEEHAG